jgi:hypothetical protein
MSCMATTTHTMVVELSHEVVVSFMRWLFREATTSFSLLALSPPHLQKSYVALHGMTYGTADVYQCTCSHERNNHLMRQLHNHCMSCCFHAPPLCQNPLNGVSMQVLSY